MDNGIWLVVGVVVVFALFVVGCALAQSQQDKEFVEEDGFKLVVERYGIQLKSPTVIDVIICESLHDAQERLNVYNWANVKGAHCTNTVTGERWKASSNGILVRIPRKVKVHA